VVLSLDGATVRSATENASPPRNFRGCLDTLQADLVYQKEEQFIVTNGYEKLAHNGQN